MPTHRTFIATYIMASGRNGTLYVGMTANLTARVWKHRTGAFDGFGKAYGCTRLVWFEQHVWVVEAIRREKRLKKWLRDWKLQLIEAANPDWRDLAEGWYPVHDPNWTPPVEDEGFPGSASQPEG
ncbi:MAG: GIY-YIG nuclease family protein [Brevundimonas sp.]|uniref:GIY-YIG nuclease family protein n=1 Tax=Brevundimonas sp. TaxID=1871086 RepID=UPI001A24B491|nr:GIY-YIG nuclease family protein [Brevundimonas sp.]MBJ7320614.1 GIY-YIG nuclease family protein [Brevundimonas sp.]